MTQRRTTLPVLTTSFFFNDTATTEIYTLSLHDALPICLSKISRRRSLSTRSRKKRFSWENAQYQRSLCPSPPTIPSPINTSFGSGSVMTTVVYRCVFPVLLNSVRCELTWRSCRPRRIDLLNRIAHRSSSQLSHLASNHSIGSRYHDRVVRLLHLRDRK